MSADPHSLEQIQRWMQAVIMHPVGVAEGMRSAPARDHIALEPAEMENVITRSETQSAEERLEVYSNAYFARLMECLREEFPIFCKAVSPEVFDGFAADYLCRYPSGSYTLNHLGDRFPRYLEETLAEEEEALNLPTFLLDLASLELTINQIFDGPGVEGQQLLTPEALREIPPERWPGAQLIPVECLRLLKFRYPIHEYYRALRKDENAIPPQPLPTILAATRRDYVVRHYELTKSAHDLLWALMDGASVGEAITAASEVVVDDELEQFLADLRGWFRLWAKDGFFRAVELAC